MLTQWRRRQSCALTAAPLCYDVRLSFRALREEMKRLEALRRRTDFLPSGRVTLRGDSRRQRPACASSFARETFLSVFAGLLSARATWPSTAATDTANMRTVLW